MAPTAAAVDAAAAVNAAAAAAAVEGGADTGRCALEGRRRHWAVRGLLAALLAIVLVAADEARCGRPSSLSRGAPGGTGAVEHWEVLEL